MSDKNTKNNEHSQINPNTWASAPPFVRRLLEAEALDIYSPMSEETLQELKDQNATQVQQISAKGGYGVLVEYPNGYGADIAKNPMTYGQQEDKWEILVMKNGEPCYDTPLTDNVIGYCSEEEVVRYCKELSELELAKETHLEREDREEEH